MRIAVIADIHGNLGALEAVVADLKEVSPDLVLNLGDCLSGPLEAAATADLLIDLGWTTIRGNHDRELIETPLEQMGASDRAAAEQISAQHRVWLACLPATHLVVPDLFLCHGTPADDMVYLTERVAADAASCQLAKAILPPQSPPHRAVSSCAVTPTSRAFSG